MTTLLAIDTATDACSIALQRAGEVRVLHRHMPRQQQQRLFEQLDELLQGEAPAALGLDAVVFGRGPGSFTGLRIAASFAQGLAYSLCVPAVGLSTLETQAWTYLRHHSPAAPCLIASTIDARVGEIYAAFYSWDGRDLHPLGDALVSRPETLSPPAGCGERALALHCIGSGFVHRDLMRVAFRTSEHCDSSVAPEAQDMLPLAEAALQRGEGLPAASAVPDYVQERTGWKTLAEQGRQA